MLLSLLIGVATTPLLTWAAVASQAYNWANVKIGGGGGFVPNIIFNPSQKGLAYARTDIGGAYKLNSDDSWTPLLDFVDNARWNYWGVDALATDPVDPDRLYLATGMYTNTWDPNNGQILISTDQGKTFTPSPLPFKLGGNMPGRGQGHTNRDVEDASVDRMDWTPSKRNISTESIEMDDNFDDADEVEPDGGFTYQCPSKLEEKDDDYDDEDEVELEVDFSYQERSDGCYVIKVEDENGDSVEEIVNDKSGSTGSLDPEELSEWFTLTLKRNRDAVIAMKNANGLREAIAAGRQVYARDPLLLKDATWKIIEPNSQLVCMLKDTIANPLSFPHKKYAKQGVLKGGLVSMDGKNVDIKKDDDPNSRKFYFRVLTFENVEILKTAVGNLVRQSFFHVPWAISILASALLSSTEISKVIFANKDPGVFEATKLTLGECCADLDDFHLDISSTKEITIVYAGTTDRSVLCRAVEDYNRRTNGSSNLITNLLYAVEGLQGVKYYAYEVADTRVPVPSMEEKMVAGLHTELENILISSLCRRGANTSHGSERIQEFWPYPKELEDNDPDFNNPKIKSFNGFIELNIFHSGYTSTSDCDSVKTVSFRHMRGAAGHIPERLCCYEGDTVGDILSGVRVRKPYVLVTYGKRAFDALESVRNKGEHKTRLFSEEIGNVEMIRVDGCSMLHVTSADASASLKRPGGVAMGWRTYLGFAAARITSAAVVRAITSLPLGTRADVLRAAHRSIMDEYRRRDWQAKMASIRRELQLETRFMRALTKKKRAALDKSLEQLITEEQERRLGEPVPIPKPVFGHGSPATLTLVAEILGMDVLLLSLLKAKAGTFLDMFDFNLPFSSQTKDALAAFCSEFRKRIPFVTDYANDWLTLFVAHLAFLDDRRLLMETGKMEWPRTAQYTPLWKFDQLVAEEIERADRGAIPIAPVRDHQICDSYKGLANAIGINVDLLFLLKRKITILSGDFLTTGYSLGKQDHECLNALCRKAEEEIPILRDYMNSWLTKAILRIFLYREIREHGLRKGTAYDDDDDDSTCGTIPEFADKHQLKTFCSIARCAKLYGSTVKIVRARMQHYIWDVLDKDVTIKEQPLHKLKKLFKMAREETPFLEEFEGDWLTFAITRLMVWLKVRKGRELKEGFAYDKSEMAEWKIPQPSFGDHPPSLKKLAELANPPLTGKKLGAKIWDAAVYRTEYLVPGVSMDDQDEEALAALCRRIQENVPELKLERYEGQWMTRRVIHAKINRENYQHREVFRAKIDSQLATHVLPDTLSFKEKMKLKAEIVRRELYGGDNPAFDANGKISLPSLSGYPASYLQLATLAVPPITVEELHKIWDESESYRHKYLIRGGILSAQSVENLEAFCERIAQDLPNLKLGQYAGHWMTKRYLGNKLHSESQKMKKENAARN